MINLIVTMLRGTRILGESYETASTVAEPLAIPSKRDCLRRLALCRLSSVLLAVILGAAALLLVHQSSHAQTTAQAQRALDVPYTKYMNPRERDALLDRLASTGAESVQTAGPWDHLEPTADDAYDWAFMDAFIASADARGLKVRMQVSATPNWVHPEVPAGSVWCPPRGDTQLGLYQDFMHDLVARYGTGVASYELWNEPNLSSFWGCGHGADPAEYAAMLRAGYLGAKSANPDVTVICCALSQNDMGYLNALYTELRKYPNSEANDDFFDALGVHPYATKSGAPLPPDAEAAQATYNGPWGHKNSAFLGIDYMVDVLNNHGDSHKKIWIGEFGYNAKPAWMTSTPDDVRAGYLKTAYNLLDERPRIVGMAWYAYYRDADRGWSIFDRTNQTESLTFQAFKEVASGGTEPPSPPSAETLTFTPVADARVQREHPNRNLGSSSTLIADGNTGLMKLTFLKFNVSGVGARTMQSATLRLYVKDGGGSNNGPGVQRSANSWTERGVTWNNRPSHQTGLQGDKGVVPGASWMEFDVTNLVTGDDTLTLAVQPTSADGTYVFSREGAVKPQLVLSIEK